MLELGHKVFLAHALSVPVLPPLRRDERTKVPLKPLTEKDLITDKEIGTLFAAAPIDLDQFHCFGPRKPRAANPYSSFADMLKCYYPYRG